MEYTPIDRKEFIKMMRDLLEEAESNEYVDTLFEHAEPFNGADKRWIIRVLNEMRDVVNDDDSEHELAFTTYPNRVHVSISPVEKNNYLDDAAAAIEDIGIEDD